VFSSQEIAHFRAFGYVVRRALLNPAEAAQLKAEVRSSIADAFGGVGTDDDPDGTGGICGDYLPLSVNRAPLSQALIADDPRLFQGSAELMGRSAVPTVPIATCFTSNAGWHIDDGPGLGGVKFIAYLEPRAAETGALRVLPGSHVPEYRSRVDDYARCDPARQGFHGWRVPGVVLQTEPGDVIAFDRQLFHSSEGGHDRLAWTIEYRPWPGLGDRDVMTLVRDSIVEAVDQDHSRYDRDRWPTWGEWVAGARGIPSREIALQRLRLLGVLGDGEAG
jgi:hypothetical protein